MERNEERLCTIVNEYVEFWHKQKFKTQKEKLNGLAFSLLRIFDGADPFFVNQAKEERPKMLHNMYMENYLNTFDK